MIPKYFVVKKDNSPEWDEFKKWFNKNYHVWGYDQYKYYGYDGNGACNGTNAFNCPSEFVNNPVVFYSAKEFMMLVNDFPEKWCVKLNNQEVADYCNRHGKIPPYNHNDDTYAHFPSLMADGQHTMTFNQDIPKSLLSNSNKC